MPDPRTVLHDRRLNEMCEKLGRHLAQERMARDDLWADYWQRRRVVVVPDDLEPPILIKNLAEHLGGKVEHVSGPLSDGSGFATISYPLPKDHWIYADGANVPPMSFRTGTDSPKRNGLGDKVRAAARYAVRASTMNGKETDFDPDAMVQNFVVGMLGYHTADGLSDDDWANPPQNDKSLENVDSLPHLPAGERTPDSDEKEWVGRNVFNWFEDGAESVIHDCIARLKAAREKEAVNKNLSTLLAVVVKVQRDLEALLNGADNG